MRWGRIDEFRSLFSEASRPERATCIDWILDPDVPDVVGRKIGRCWFIDLDRFERSTGNPLADRILAAAA